MASLIRTRAYSSQVTHDFINSILARAQEATSKNKEVINASRPTGKFQNQRGKKNFNQNRGNGKRIQVKDENKATPPPTGARTKQPQFKKAQGNKSNGVVDNDMLDVLSKDTSKLNSRNGSINRNRNTRTQGNKKSHMINSVNVTKRTASPREVALRKPSDSTTFEPFIPTPMSLFPYSTPIFNLPVNNILNASMKTMKDSAAQKSCNVASYNAAKSGILDKERFLSTTKLDIDLDVLKTTMHGEYFILPMIIAKDFDKLTKKEDKRADLLKNSLAVRYALNANNMPEDKKQILYEVCTGLKPVVELSELKV
ncbi:Small ribosomal subunit protein mS46 [Nakaseomyces bracarensis]|uniref:Small ribosomal subunit protein mS46 n=1 Tax=Nakaseomyces bracarensis TaxID=273131 RepID=A0ABR4NV26_9SACH